jgi:hypothetical protein
MCHASALVEFFLDDSYLNKILMSTSTISLTRFHVSHLLIEDPVLALNLRELSLSCQLGFFLIYQMRRSDGPFDLHLGLHLRESHSMQLMLNLDRLRVQC